MARMEGVELTGAAMDARGTTDLLMAQPPHLILVDLHLKDGLERDLCAELRVATDLPIIVLASFMTEERWHVLYAAGATTYLLKHLDSDQFGRELRELAGTSRDGQKV